MPALSGSEKARHYAQFGVMRFGASRFGYHSAHAFVTIAGTHVAYGRASTAYKLESASLTITDALDETPNTCAFTISGFTPTVGQEVIIALGSKNNSDRLFAGHILTVTQLQATAVATVHYAVTAIDYTWLLQGRKVVKRYTNQSATAIITDLMTSFAPSGFTTTKVASGLATLDEFTVSGDEDIPGAISRVMKRIGGYWYVDYHKDVHAFTGTESGITHPVNLTTSHVSLQDFQHRRDNSQVVTRALVEGGGANATMPRAVGNTTLPVEDATWYASGGGTVVCGPQRLTYTGKEAGGTGSTAIGVNQSPSAPTAASAGNQDGKLGVGAAYTHKVSFAGVTGESELSAASGGVTLSAVSAPGACTAAALAGTAGNLSVGNYLYKVTFVNPNGETAAGTASDAATIAAVSSSSANGTLAQTTGGNMALAEYTYSMSYVTARGETPPTTFSFSITLTGSNNAVSITNLATSSDNRVTKRNLYRRRGAGATYLVTTIGDNTTTTYTDVKSDAELSGIVPPTTNTAGSGQVAITSIPTGNAGTTARKIYRTRVDGSTYHFLTTISGNVTTTYTDNLADDSLGADAPSASTADGGQISLSSVPLGPSGTTKRNIWRTALGGSVYKYVGTIHDNSTTTFTDNLGDSSLGVTAPERSTWPTPIASIMLQVADLAQFPASGWVRSESQIVRYTGRSAASGIGTLTGIPASGTGAIIAAIASGSAVVVQPHLVGIPASGTGSILYTINQGDPVNILVTRNNTSAQTALAALIGGNGIVEEYVTDNRLSITECTARGDAVLDLRSAAEASITYRSRDKNTRAGRTITVNLGAPTSVSASFKIQNVTITGFSANEALFPTFTASASSTRFSFQDLLRLARKGGEVA